MLVPLAACTVAPSESTSVADLINGKIVSNKIVSNKIVSNKIVSNKLAAAKLATNRLSNGALAVNLTTAQDLLSTEDGREVFTFLVSCALPADVVLQATIGGVDFRFPGEIGLTPQWQTRALDRVGQGWVSACMFSRVNAHDVSVPISLHGPNRALSVTGDESAAFTVEEGAFYGTMFTPDDQPINWIACRGRGVASGATGLDNRDCAKPDPDHPGLTQCGFFDAGDCGRFARDHACEAFDKRGQFYLACHARALGGDDDDDDRDDDHGGEDHHRVNPVFHEVITSFVRP